MKIGEKVEEFVAADQEGREVRLSQLLGGGAVVLFFYPAAMTPGCTKESCHFRDLAGEFTAVRAQRIGISADAVDRQKEFDRKYALGFPLLSDPERKIARQFGVKRFGPFPSKRATFVIGEDGTLLASYASELNMDAHADEALEVLRARNTA